MKNIITCKICGSSLTGRQLSYCSAKCKNKANQSYKAQQERGLKRKKIIVEKLGGCCQICGYNKNLSALTFHHNDPKEKDFQLDLRSLSNRKLSQIYIELEKCILVCSNCHSEMHYPKHSLE